MKMNWPSTRYSTTFALQDDQMSQPSDESKRFVCTQAGCRRQFTRKEHLNRHLESHNPHPRYTCHLCDKKFARSDVLKRHIEKHPRSSNVRRTVVACTACHERKLRCDNDTPCQSCARQSLQCVRNEPSLNGNTQARVMGPGEEVTATDGSVQLPVLSPDNTSEGNLTTSRVESPQSWEASANLWYQVPFTSAESNIMVAANGITDEMTWTANGSVYPNTDASSLLPVYDPLVELQSSNSHAGSDIGLPSFLIQPLPSAAISSSSSVPSSHPTSLLLPASSVTTHEDSPARLEDCLDTTSPTMRRYIQTYFTKIHHHWPILHEPTFDIRKITPNLRASMIILASYHEGGDHHRKIAPILFEAVLSAHLEPEPSLQNMQALVLCVVYTLQLLMVENMLAKALHLNSVLICTCRYRGVFNGEFDCRDAEDDDPVTFWLLQEQVRRLAYAVLQVDVYLSMLTDHPPSVRYQEMTIPLPKSPALWAAATAQQRRQLQWAEPGGREKDMFSTIMGDVLNLQQQDRCPRQLSVTDYHLILCALQIGSWDAAREAHSAASDELVAKRSPGSPIEIWRTYLNTWRTHIEQECHLRQTYFSTHINPDDRRCAPLSLILWHTSVMKMHAPLDLLRSGYHTKRKHHNDLSARQFESHLRSWLASSCPRLAVWNAAQIIRIVVRELEQPPGSDRLRLNPLGLLSLLLSAIVVCAFAKHTRACSACTTDFESHSIDLFEAEDNNEALLLWKSSGKGIASLGNLGVVCQCQTTRWIAFFKQYLSVDAKLESELASFTDYLA